jgi:hypothetical protein
LIEIKARGTPGWFTDKISIAFVNVAANFSDNFGSIRCPARFQDKFCEHQYLDYADDCVGRW